MCTVPRSLISSNRRPIQQCEHYFLLAIAVHILTKVISQAPTLDSNCKGTRAFRRSQHAAHIDLRRSHSSLDEMSQRGKRKPVDEEEDDDECSRLRQLAQDHNVSALC